MSHILLLPFGTSGSVFPFIWLGKHLLERGHQVTLIASQVYQKPAEAAGIGFHPPTPDELPAMLANPNLWDAGPCKKVAFEHAGRAVAPCASAIEEIIRDQGMPDLMLAPMISFGARIAREKHGIPLITVHLYPAAMMSADDAPLVIPGARLLRRLPHPVRKFVLSLPSPYDRFALPAVTRACSDHGVEPPRRLWKKWHHSPDGVLALYPAWFSHAKLDKPQNTYQWDFPLEDLALQTSIAQELERFLCAGEKPVLFTAGTGQAHAAGFFRTAAEVVSELGCRAIFLTTTPEQVPTDLPESVMVVAYAPFSALLPRAALMVHHGGIGTLSQCLAAGIPQLVAYMSLDQPDNASRIERLGVGLSIPMARLNRSRLLPLVKRCMLDPAIRKTAAVLAVKMQHRKPVTGLIEWVEKSMSIT
jgi:rhamnosyltransferase subunit B